MNVAVYDSFEGLPAVVRRALSFDTQRSLFTTVDWFERVYTTSMVEHLVPRIYVCSDDQGLPLAALFCAVSRNASGSMRTLLSLTNFYALEYSFCFAGGGTNMPAVRSLARYIVRERPSWDLIRLFLAQGDDPAVLEFSSELQRGRFSCQRFFQFENWYQSLRGEDFATYFSNRSSQVKNTINRKQKKLAKLHRIDLTVARGRSPDLPAMTAAFVRVYESSWKQPEPFPEFIPGLIDLCADLGSLRLGVLFVDDEPAAAQLWITSSAKAIIYKLAYVERFGDLGAGSVLSREMFRVAIDEDKVDEIDYGVGSDAYKRDWMSAKRDLLGLEAWNKRTLRGATMGLSRHVVDSSRRVRTLLVNAAQMWSPKH